MKERKFFKRKPRKCPECGFSPISSILYGFPAYSAELKESLNNKSVVLGGCVIGLDDPKWQCSDCETEFYPWNSFSNRLFLPQ